MLISKCNLKIANAGPRNLKQIPQKTLSVKNELTQTIEIISEHDNKNIGEGLKQHSDECQSFLSCNTSDSKYLTSKTLSCSSSNLPILLDDSQQNDTKNNALRPAFLKIANCNRNAALSDSPKTANSRPYIMGIDPGIKGAVAILDIRENHPKLVTVFDMPTSSITIKGKKRDRLDILTLGLKIDAYSPLILVALIEEVAARPTDGRSSIFVFGFATGAVHGVLGTCMIPTEKVKPTVWKLEMGLSSDKSASIERAKKYIPESDKYLTLKKHDGRAEAILLAWYAWKHLRN